MAIVMISRGTLSGGKAIAESLAKRLGYPCVSRETLFNEAESFGITKAELNLEFSKPHGFWKPSPGTRMAALTILRAALLKLSRNGNLVYHGFAGHLLLDGVSHILRVRVIAGLEYRIFAAMQQLGLNREDAIARIRKEDKESVYWARYHYGVDWQDPSLYDVILNIDLVGIDSAVAILEHMTGLKEFTPDVESRQAFEDLLLASMVWATLSKDSRTRFAQIKVEATSGTVTITGNAGSTQTVRDIELLASEVPGVTHVVWRGRSRLKLDMVKTSFFPHIA